MAAELCLPFNCAFSESPLRLTLIIFVFLQGDVGTWLRLLDLSQYHNTLNTNRYGVMEEVFHITWEDLQDIGIDMLGT